MADFYFKTTKFQSLLLSIPQSIRYLCTLLFLGLIFLIWYSFIYRPLNDHLLHCQTRYDNHPSLQSVRAKIEKKNNKVALLGKKKSELLNTLKNRNLQKNESSHNVPSTSFSNFFEYAQQAALVINSHTPLKTTEKNWLTTFESVNEFDGNFSAIIQFLKSLTAHNDSLLLNKLTITKHDNETLALTLHVTAHKFQEEHL